MMDHMLPVEATEMEDNLQGTWFTRIVINEFLHFIFISRTVYFLNHYRKFLFAKIESIKIGDDKSLPYLSNKWKVHHNELRI